jgi:hypothetical protein
MIKNVYRLKVVRAPFTWVLERAPRLPHRLDPLLNPALGIPNAHGNIA